MEDNRRVVVGVFETRARAEQALEDLRRSGFDAEDVSILAQDPDASLPDQTNADAAETADHATAGAVAGGLAGAVAGWVLGAGSLLIPGVGPFIAAGALASALTGAAVGAGLGAIGGALTHLGVPEEDARWYAQQVRGGRSLVTVNAGRRYDEAQALLRRHGGKDVRTRDPERVGYGVAGGSSSMEGEDEPQSEDAHVATGTRVFPSMPEAPATGTERSSATPSRASTPRP